MYAYVCACVNACVGCVCVSLCLSVCVFMRDRVSACVCVYIRVCLCVSSSTAVRSQLQFPDTCFHCLLKMLQR